MKSFYKINSRVLIMLLILFALTGVAVSALTFLNLQGVYKKHFTERVQKASHLIAASIDGDEIEYYANLLYKQDEAFKKRQYQFHVDRENLYSLDGGSDAERADIISRMEAFHRDMEAFKSDKYRNIISKLKKLKEASGLKYVYIFADTGVTDDEGAMLYTYLFDAEDADIYTNPDSDGFAIATRSVDDTSEIYETKKGMDKVFYYKMEPYGELYYTYAPILNSTGEIVALLGTDVELREMRNEIWRSMVLFNAVFLAFITVIVLTTYLFLSRSVTLPLGQLMGTARKLIDGDTSASVPPNALKQRSELGVLANLINDMGRTAVIANQFDLTAQKGIQRALEYRSDLLLAVSRVANLLLEAQIEETSETVLNYAVDIKNASHSLLAIINDVLDISKIESGRLEIIPTRYAVSSLLMDVIRIIKIKADAKRIPLVVNIDANLPCELYGDEIRIRQILINILNNAVKFTKEGFITFSASGEMSGDEFIIKCVVSDTGIGIKDEDMLYLFEMFAQMDTKKNRELEGTGLGLSISRQLAERMGGDISVKSQYGKGSEFTVTISQEIANPQPAAALINPQRNAVLVYENRSLFLNSLSYAFDSLGCRYKICRNQSELYEQLKEFKCNYIFASSLHLHKVKALASQVQPDAVIAGILGESDMPFGDGLAAVSMPIQSLQIASILNAGYESSNNKSDHVFSIAAPEARVLVVDDNVVNLKVAAGLLKAYEIQCDSAISGSRALELVRESSYDLIFMDHMMPDMDGIDTTIAIRRLGGAHAEIPIVALTANVVSGAKEMFIAEGFNDYLPKPIEVSKLKAILVKWLPAKKQSLKSLEAKKTRDYDLHISGLDTQAGLARAGGSPESYMDILTVYCYDGEKRLKEMRDFYERGERKLLASYAHALKSASSNIGAEEIARMAAGLEFAGNNNDAAYVDSNLQAFIEAASALIFGIENYLSKDDKEKNTAEAAGDISLLAKSAAKISELLESADISSIEDELNGLLQYSWEDDISLLLNEIKDSISVFDYDAAENAALRLKAFALGEGE